MSNKTVQVLKKILIIAVIPVLVYLLLMPYTVDGEINTLDEGMWLSDASSILNGKLLYRDIWFIHGPALLHSLTAAMRLFGDTLGLQRTFFWFLNLAGFIFAYIFATRYIKDLKYAVFASFFMLGSACVHLTLFTPVIFRQNMGFAVFILLLLYMRNQEKTLLFFAGLTGALIFLFSHEVGISILFISFIFLALQVPQGKHRLSLIYGIITVILPFLLYLAITGTLSSYFKIAFIEVFSIIKESNSAPGILKLIPGNLHEAISMYIIPVFYFILFLRYALRKSKIKEETISLLLSIYGLCLCLYALTRWDIWHAYFTLPPAIIISFNYLVRGRKPAHKYAIIIFIILFWSFMTLPHIIKRNQHAAGLRNISIPLELRRAGNISVPEVQATHIKNVVDYISTHSNDEYIYVFPHQGIYYFLAEKRNPTRFSMALLADSESRQEEVVIDLKRTEPEYILVTVSRWIYDGMPFDRSHSIIWEYITSSYIETIKIGATYILKKSGAT